MNEAVKNWKQKGNIYLFRNRFRPELNWEFTIDGVGSASLLQLFRLMESSDFTSEATIDLGTPSAKQRQTSDLYMQRLIFRHSPRKMSSNHWNVSIDVEKRFAKIESGVFWLGELKNAIFLGCDQYTIGVGETVISVHWDRQF